MVYGGLDLKPYLFKLLSRTLFLLLCSLKSDTRMSTKKNKIHGKLSILSTALWPSYWLTFCFSDNVSNLLEM